MKRVGTCNKICIFAFRQLVKPNAKSCKYQGCHKIHPEEVDELSGRQVIIRLKAGESESTTTGFILYVEDRHVFVTTERDISEYFKYVEEDDVFKVPVEDIIDILNLKME